MKKFEYTLEEHANILQALGTKKIPKPTPIEIWNSKCVDEVKRRFKQDKILEQREKCCYCLRNIRGEYSMVIDIEHILPKHIFTHCIFDLQNLAISCKRCNMKFKGRSIDFLTTDLQKFKKIDKSSLFRKEYYKFAHPNLVRVSEHLLYQCYQSEPSIKIIKYKPITEQGWYAYHFFGLKELESESFNLCQGQTPPKSEEFFELVKAIERDIYGE